MGGVLHRRLGGILCRACAKHGLAIFFGEKKVGAPHPHKKEVLCVITKRTLTFVKFCLRG